MKRIVDIVLAILVFALVWPVLAVCAVLVKFSSPGPVFYRGIRTGLHGKPFRIFKFRSMRTDAEQTGGTTTGDNDPRITPIGFVLRKYKLDELPQLFNVMFGDMSFVGPRPEVSEYTDAYQGDELQILDARPGITDLASLEFNDLQSHVGEDDPDEAYRSRILPMKNALRLKYVREQSMLLDLKIITKTALVVLSKPFRQKKNDGIRKSA